MPKRDHVILIKPSALDNFNASKGGSFLPLGLLFLAQSLLEHGYRVTLLDEGNEEVLRRVEGLVDERTLCFGISTMSGAQLGNAIWIHDRLKERFPQVPIIWGGVHVTALPEQSLRSGRVETLVWGEGEQSFPKLLQAIEAGDDEALETIPGIGFTRGGRSRITPNSGYTPLKGVMRLPYHLVDMDRYRRQLKIGAKREYAVYTSRGCPFKCTFCSIASETWPNTKVRQHSIEHIVEDIRTLVHEYGADMISFADEGFLFNSRRLLSILEALDREGIRVKFRFSSRVDLILKLTDQEWDRLQDYGLVAVGMGVESGNPEMLEYMNKGITLEQIRRLNAILTERRIYKTFNFMIANPKETLEQLKDTLRLIAELARSSTWCPYPFTVFRYIPYPGTRMYQDAVERGLEPPTDLEGWTLFDTMDSLERLREVRPWISGRYLEFLRRLGPVYDRMLAAFTGEDADEEVIESRVAELEELIEAPEFAEEPAAGSRRSSMGARRE